VPAAIAPTRLRPAQGWWVDLTLVAAFVALTVALINGHLLGWDQRVADWVVGHRPAPLYRIARVGNYLGQGGLLLMPASLLLTAVLAWRSRSVRAVFPFLAAFLLTYVTIGPLKIWAGRAAPAFRGPDRTVMFNPHASGAEAMSYPSGHMGNSLVWYAVLALLAAALLGRPLTARESFLVRFLPVVILFVTTVYTGFHWLTDSVAGVLLGLFLTRLLARIPWDTLPLPALRGWNRPAGLSPGDRPATRPPASRV
jgi:membrane-associated phospholipid phosphatase